MKKFFILIVFVVVLVFAMTKIKKVPTIPEKIPEQKTVEVVTENNIQANFPCAITLLEPKPNDAVSLPVDVRMIVDNTKVGCHWNVFEGIAGVARLTDEDGIEHAIAPLYFEGETWMTVNPVEYKVSLKPLVLPLKKNLTVTIYEDVTNDIDVPQQFSFPITIK